MGCGESREQEHADGQELVVDGHVAGESAVELDVVDASCLDPGQQPGRVAIDSLLGEADEFGSLAVVEEGSPAVEGMEGTPGCM